MWYGDMVTCIDYRNVWLNEGFGTYCDARYAEFRSSHSAFLNLMNSRATYYFNEDAHQRFPTYDPPLSQIYAGGAIYYKGSWIQHMLRYLMNDTIANRPGAFYRALRAYGDSFKYGGASTEDYRRINERESGLDLGWFFNEWLYQAGYPQYRLTWTVSEPRDIAMVTINLTQNNGSNAPTVFHMPVQLKFRATQPDTHETLVVVPVAANPHLDTFTFTFRPDTVIFDPGKWILKKATVAAIAEESGLNPTPELELSLPSPAPRLVQLNCRAPEAAQLALYDATGRRVRAWSLAPGRTQIALDGGALPAGVYLVRLATAHEAVSRKLAVTH
jgi:hypothetical protein